MANRWGRFFTLSTWGESHGPSIGALIDGCPPRVPISIKSIQEALDRRRPGANALGTARDEADQVHVRSGIYKEMTLGTPIVLEIFNKDARPEDYAAIQDVYRPSHADYSYEAKYGIRDARGGGRASARETAARVAAGSIAQHVLAHFTQIHVLAYVSELGGIAMPALTTAITPEAVHANPVGCPHPETAQAMKAQIEAARDEGDSLGGIISCVITGVPAGLGSPVFDRLEADFAKAMLSIPSTKGFELGSGFAAARMKGSQHNDPFDVSPDGRIHTTSNHSGGIQGGISNGAPIEMRIAFKAPSSIKKIQKTVNQARKSLTTQIEGRHDPCVLPRALPIVESMAHLVLVDHWMCQRAQCGQVSQ